MTEGRRVLVCGGRDFRDLYLLQALDQLHAEKQFTVVIQGGARGADRMAASWAKLRGIRCITYEADWTDDGMSAGPRRNRRMLVEGKPDLVVAFPGGKGTANMVKQARAAGVEVMTITPEHREAGHGFGR